MSDRKSIQDRVKIASALRYMAVEIDGKLVRALTQEEADNLTTEEVLSLFEWDHIVPLAVGGSDRHSNLRPVFIAAHRLKTRKKDIPEIAKTKRISKEHAEFQRKILAKSGLASGVEKTETKPRSAWPKGRKLQSRGFPKKTPRPSRPA